MSLREIGEDSKGWHKGDKVGSFQFEDIHASVLKHARQRLADIKANEAGQTTRVRNRRSRSPLRRVPDSMNIIDSPSASFTTDRGAGHAASKKISIRLEVATASLKACIKERMR